MFVSFNSEQSLLAQTLFRSIPPEVFLGKGEYQCRSMILVSCKGILLKLHLGMDVLLQICCIISGHLFYRTPPGDCFWLFKNFIINTIGILIVASHCLGITLQIFAVYVSNWDHIHRFHLQINKESIIKRLLN